MRKTFFISLVVALSLWACSNVSAQNATVNLADFGAVGDNVFNNGPAFQAALDSLAVSGGGTLIVPAGKYAITTPVAKDFTGLASSITILGVPSSTPVDNTGGGSVLSKGLDLTSEIYPKTGTSGVVLRVSGLQTFLIQDIAFVGTDGISTDAHTTVAMERIEDATVRHCEFYGLISQVQGGSIVYAERSRLRIESTKFLGSTGNSGIYVPVVQNYRWKAITVTNTTFVDYGQRPELFGKVTVAPISWIHIGNAEAVTPDSPRREVIITDVFMDEGAYVGLYSLPFFYSPPSAPIDLIYVSHLIMNVTNLGSYGHFFDGVKGAMVEKSRYQWSTNAGAGIYFHNVSTGIIDQSEFLVDANRIAASSATSRLSVINSVYDFLDSQAAFTEEITTPTIEEDPVQYVRLRFQDVLGRDPEPAAHFYWSDLLLRCGANQACVTAKRADMEAYLATSPSILFSLSGQVVDQAGQPMANVPVTLSGSQAVSMPTDANGNYSFSNLPTSGSYTITVGPKLHYLFANSSQTFTTPAGDQTADFSAEIKTYSITGRTQDNNVLPGATITLTGSASDSTTTDSGGNFVLADLPALGDYTITPTKRHYTFTPVTQSYTALDSDKAVIFTALLNRYSVGGRITTPGGTPIAGVSVSLNGTESKATTTGADGRYLFSNVAAGGNYTVTPSKTNYLFTVPSTSITDLSANSTVDFQGQLREYTISGRITSGSTAVSGVLVTLSGSKTGTATTDNNGDYSISVTAEGTYTVTPSKKHLTFGPVSQTFSNVGGSNTANFSATTVLYTISGRVLNPSGTAVSGVGVTLSGSVSSFTNTDDAGNYSFANLPGGGNFTVTPTKSGSSFTPSSQSINDLSANQTVGFTAGAPRSITGRVTKGDGSGVAGVTLNLSGSSVKVATTDGSGNYSFSDLAQGGNYTVTPVSAHYSFDPTTRSITNLSDDQTANFTATIKKYTISGSVTLNSMGQSGVTVTLSGSQSASTTTASNGSYTFSVDAGGNYTVTPSKSGISFAPASQSFTNLSANQTAGFAVSGSPRNITGRVTNAGGSGVAGITMNLSGSSVSTATTDGSGNYSFLNLSEGGNYTITPATTHYTFEPATRSFTNLTTDQTADFTATVKKYNISGRVTLNELGFAGVTVTLSGSQSATATTASDGSYSFTADAAGNYTVTPSKTNYNFTPQNAAINNLSANQVVSDFDGKLNIGVPVLVSHANSTRAVAYEAISQLSEPFDLTEPLGWFSDGRTRVVLFAMNFTLLSNEGPAAVTAEAQNAAGQIFPLQVERVDQVPGLPWLNSIVVRLHDNMTNGDVLVRITYHSIGSNRVRLGIGQIEGGPPDDPGSVPTPGQEP